MKDKGTQVGRRRDERKSGKIREEERRAWELRKRWKRWNKEKGKNDNKKRLKENEDIKSENINYSKEDTQINGSIPRRLVAQCCIDSLKNKESINKLIEVTSSNDNKKISFKKAMQMI